MAPISIPTTARLPSSLRVDPSNPAVFKILNRLSRASLLTLSLDWLDERNLALAAPYLRPPSSSEYDDEDEYADDFNPPARSLDALQELYTSLQSRKGSKREVIDRIIEGDWRHGLTLYQLAMADIQYLYDHPTSQKWAAYRIMPLKPLSTNDDEEEQQQQPEIDKESLVIPRFHPSTFLKNLQAQVPPDVKAHYNFDRHRTLPLSILRIFILDSPYNTSLGLQSGSSKTGRRKAATTTFDTSRTVYIAFPDASPYIYISKPQLLSGSAPPTGSGPGSSTAKATGINTTAGEAKSLQHLLLVGIPAALSRPRQRFCLKPTSLATRNLNELLDRRGGANTRQGAAGGGWSIYADEMRDKGKDRRKRGNRETPLDTVLPSPPLSEEEEEEEGDKEEHGVGKGKEEGNKRVEPPLSPGAKKEQRERKRRKLVANARFADTGLVGDGKGVERVDIVLEDEFPSPSSSSSSRDRDRERETPGDRGSGSSSSTSATAAAAAGKQEGEEQWRPTVKLTFHGSHVFAGIRQLVEAGIIDGERMPGWLTGEEGVTVGKVREGRIRGHKGSGL
ncbi:CHL4 family chromosome segregation protein [Copromyces sp. CBS 386.78]|nr:CHL4 family chromosome segregation protein [Copromyces sp. CBS 386.78]